MFLALTAVYHANFVKLQFYIVHVFIFSVILAHGFIFLTIEANKGFMLDQMLVVLTLTGQLYLFAKDGTVIHQTSFAVDGSAGDDLVAYHTYFMNIYGNPEKAYHNCVAVRGASVYILGPMHLIVSRLLPWKERIQVLRRAGDWMGALNMAMTLYDGQAHGVIDLPRSVDAVQEIIMPI